MSLASALVPEALPRVAIDLDEFSRSRLKEAWELVATHGEDAVLTGRIRDAADAVVNAQIVIVFGGHWSAGKSTLINALLGRDLLPVSERTETGVACRIHVGAADEATSMRAYGSIAIPCTPEAIAEQVSITAGGAEPRSELDVVDAIELTLAGAPLPPNVRWIDTPGLNDAPDAEDRLRREVDRADQLLWVLNPDQFLSEVEQRFLADYVTRRSVASVTLLVNVRTHQDVASDWRRFHDEGWLAHRAKLEHFWDTAGIPESSWPPVLIASGAHLREEFGSRNLLQFFPAPMACSRGGLCRPE
jgi:GTPase SAR1 family protein